MEFLNKNKVIIKTDNINESKKKIFNEIISFLENHENLREQIKKIFRITNHQSEKDIIYNYLSDIWLFINDKKYCFNCPGLDKCNKSQPYYRHYVLNLIYDNNFVFQELSPCNLQNKYIEKNYPYIFENLIYFGPFRDFPASLLELKMSDLDTSRNREQLFKRYIEILKSISTKIKTKWIFIYGSYSSGKTFVSVAILNDLLTIISKKTNKNKEIAVFLNFSKRISELKELFFSNKSEFEKIIYLYSHVPILVLDNFGDEYKSEFIRDEIVWPILFTRSQANYLTILNSRFSYDELLRMYSLGKDKIKSKQLIELLMKNCGEQFDISTKIYL